MGLFHRHDWRVIVTTWAPPAYGLHLKGGVTMSEHMAERLTFGVTTTLLKCACGKVRIEEQLGQKTSLVPPPAPER